MSDKLPVARCEMCRWWGEVSADEYGRPVMRSIQLCHHARVIQRNRKGDDWCSEFEHHELGPRIESCINTYTQKWRFPNE